VGNTDYHFLPVQTSDDDDDDPQSHFITAIERFESLFPLFCLFSPPSTLLSIISPFPFFSSTVPIQILQSPMILETEYVVRIFC